VRDSPLGPLLLIGAACAACMVGGLYLAGQPFDWRYALLLGYFVVVTFFLLRWQEGAAGKTNIFIRRFMAGMIIKLMGSIILMVVLMKVSPAEMTLPLVILFVGLYVAFMSFSVARLMRIIRTPQP
jgi:F0F1-type ATP synthase assembly protein I